MSLIRVKKSFTLIELIIVILIISVTYFLIFSNVSFNTKNKEEKVTLYNLEDFLLRNFEFERSLSFVCIEDKFTCFVKVDDKLQKDFKIEKFFKQKPDVYEYYKDEKRVEFKELRVNDFNYEVIFELKINSDYKINEFIIDTLDDEVFVFNSIFTKPKRYKTLRESYEVFELNKIEVKNAF
jgi:hypothetical protein